MDSKRNIEDFDLVFLDLETTGLDVITGDTICEIGAVKIKKRKVVDSFHSLVNPKRKMPSEAYLVHKISDEELKGAPYFEEVADRLLGFFSDCVICAYNVDFDMGFINYELRGINHSPLELPAIDILGMARKTLKLPKYNLSALADFFNIEIKRKHRALEDASVASQAFFKLSDILKEKGVEKLEDFISLYGMNNDIFKAQAEPKQLCIQEAITKGEGLRMRYVSYENNLEEERVKPLNFYQENKYFYLHYENANLNNVRISLDRILRVEKV